MQELEYFRGGATLVISVNGLNRLFKRRCRDKGINQRNEELHPRKYLDQIKEADEERPPVVCFCVLDQRGNTAFHSWGNTGHTTALTNISENFCLPKQIVQQSTFSSLDYILDVPDEAKITFTTRDIFSLPRMVPEIMTKQEIIGANPHKRFIIVSDDCIPAQCLRSLTPLQDFKVFFWHPDFYRSDINNMSFDLKIQKGNGFEGDCSGADIRHNLNNFNYKSLLKRCQRYRLLGESSASEVKKRKSVSFNDDVMVYLFDEESPTVKLHSNYSSNLPSFTVEDSGLEWEDDFSALEKSCHVQCARHSQYCGPSTPSWTVVSRPESSRPSQSCLVLTYVTEADLDM